MARCIRQVRPWEQYGSIHSTIRSLGSHRSSRALSKTFQMYRIMFAPNDQIVEWMKPCLRLPKINITNSSWSIQQSVVNDQTRRTDRAVFGPRNKHVKCFEPLVVPKANLSSVSGHPSSQGSCGRVCRKMLSHCASQGFLALVCSVSLCLPLIRLATCCFSIAVIASALLLFAPASFFPRAFHSHVGSAALFFRTSTGNPRRVWRLTPGSKAHPRPALSTFKWRFAFAIICTRC